MPIRKSRVSGITASGTTADRPSNPSIGDTFFNGTLGVQEIYTDSGWLPATGANDFNVVLTGSETSVTLDKEYFSGAYTITSALSDNTFDIYLFDTSNNAAGYSNTPSINATDNFNKIIVYGGTNGDLLSFSYKTTFTTSATTTDTFAAPYITSVSVADLANIDDTTTITGGNFDTDIEVWFDGQNSYSQQAKSVVYGSSTSIVATRPDDLVEDNAPYTIRVVNPGTTSPSGSNKNKLIDSITAGGDPVWVTSQGALPNAPYTGASLPYSTTVQATDPDGGAISYSLAAGQLPTGLTLNASTGVIGGTMTGISQSFTIAATDSGGNITNRSFSIGSDSAATGGDVQEISGYRVHTFTSSGTFYTDINNLQVEYLVVGGGGGGGTRFGGGGGAGGYREGSLTLTNGSHVVTVGNGGAAGHSNNIRGSSGSASSFYTIESAGGGGGASENQSALGGGSGGGGSYGANTPGSGNVPATTPAQGFVGGVGQSSVRLNGGGGGASQPGFGSGSRGNGGAGKLSSISGTSTAYAGGGGGADNRTDGGGQGTGAQPWGEGGVGGGGSGGGTEGSGTGDSKSGYGEDGDVNTGGGGGGGAYVGSIGTSRNGGNGGSGIVIVRYPI